MSESQNEFSLTNVGSGAFKYKNVYAPRAIKLKQDSFNRTIEAVNRFFSRNKESGLTGSEKIENSAPEISITSGVNGINRVELLAGAKPRRLKVNATFFNRTGNNGNSFKKEISVPNDVRGEIEPQSKLETNELKNTDGEKNSVIAISPELNMTPKEEGLNMKQEKQENESLTNNTRLEVPEDIESELTSAKKVATMIAENREESQRSESAVLEAKKGTEAALASAKAASKSTQENIAKTEAARKNTGELLAVLKIVYEDSKKRAEEAKAEEKAQAKLLEQAKKQEEEARAKEQEVLNACQFWKNAQQEVAALVKEAQNGTGTPIMFPGAESYKENEPENVVRGRAA